MFNFKKFSVTEKYLKTYMTPNFHLLKIIPSNNFSNYNEYGDMDHLKKPYLLVIPKFTDEKLDQAFLKLFDRILDSNIKRLEVDVIADSYDYNMCLTYRNLSLVFLKNILFGDEIIKHPVFNEVKTLIEKIMRYEDDKTFLRLKNNPYLSEFRMDNRNFLIETYDMLDSKDSPYDAITLWWNLNGINIKEIKPFEIKALNKKLTYKKINL